MLTVILSLYSHWVWTKKLITSSDRENNVFNMLFSYLLVHRLWKWAKTTLRVDKQLLYNLYYQAKIKEPIMELWFEFLVTSSASESKKRIKGKEAHHIHHPWVIWAKWKRSVCNKRKPATNWVIKRCQLISWALSLQII